MVATLNMIVREFNRSDNAEIAQWFQDSESTRWLESAWSESELDQMALEENFRHYVAVEEGILIGSIGCYLPVEDFDCHVLSYVHVAPWCRRRGIARKLIAWLLQKHGPGCKWRCYINHENAASMSLFDRLQWQRVDEQPGKNGMYTYELFT